MKIIAVLSIPIVIVVVLKKRQTISDQIATALIAIIIGIGIIFSVTRLFDISNRDNMNFDEYNFTASFSKDGKHVPSVLEYDIQQLSAIENEVTGAGSNFGNGICIGSACCGDTMTYNTKKLICEPSARVETFISGQPAYIGSTFGVNDAMIINREENPNYYS